MSRHTSFPARIAIIATGLIVWHNHGHAQPPPTLPTELLRAIAAEASSVPVEVVETGPETITEPSPATTPSLAEGATPPVDPAARDPFWPVGYAPPTLLPATGGPAAADKPQARVAREVPWPAIPVRGRSRTADGTYLALIDGIGVVRAGDDISIQKDGFWFHWRILEIDARQMQTERLGVTRQQKQLPNRPAP